MAIQPRVRLDSLRQTKATEYMWRFLFGGAVTVLASLVAKWWGPVIGGMFLAFPGIFPPSATLVEKHKIEREAKQGKQGVRSARAEASVEAAGASIGALGLAAFALAMWKGLPGHDLAEMLVVALAAWGVVSWCGWWVREKM